MTPVTDPAPPSAPTPPPSGVLHLRTWIPASLDERFSAWCDGHHVEQLVVPGFRRVRRFSLARSTATEPARFLTIYDLDRLEVVDGPAYAEYRNRSTGLPEFLQGRLRAARSDAWLVAAAPAVDAMVPDGSGLVHLFLTDTPDAATWFAERGLALVRAVGGTTARLLHSRAGEQIVLIELPDGADVDAVELDPLDLPDGAPVGTGWGSYRLDYVARPDGTDPSGS